MTSLPTAGRIGPTLAQCAAACAALLTLATGRLDGQEGFRFRSGVDLVNVTATVTDRAGRFVSGLSQADFTVYEDERPVDITHFSAERVPVSLGLVLDTSGSMQGDKIENALAAIERFLERLLNPDDEVFVYGFSSEVELLQDWTTNRRAVSASLRRVRAAGGTAIYDAMVEAVPMAHRGRHQKKAVVLLSDGNDTSSRASVRDVREVVRETEVLVYAIGIDGRAETMTPPRVPTFPRAPTPAIPFPFPGGSRPGTRRPPRDAQLPGWKVASERLNVAALREMTDDSGGRTEVVSSTRDLDPATSSIADELTRQYYLGYASVGPRDGRWHALRVEVRDPSLRVRARRGYRATS